ncbi:unnamed protein product [Taenia asiatica]|uniref:ULP_PROTEASE domain-containing protein n=1 Tax=Taenia asiatica TaxID=60517 RepID=A0A158R9H6_TAEAS|nr:unnamed protein product [Taenia asiatica]
MRKLRSRRNLVDSTEATNNATFEISVAPLGDTGNEVENVSKAAIRGKSGSAKKKRLRSRRNLVNSLSAAADNATFELSVAQLSERKNEAMDEARGLGATTSHEASLSQAKIRDSSKGGRSSPMSQVGSICPSYDLADYARIVFTVFFPEFNQSTTGTFVNAENDGVTMEISATPLPARPNGGQIEEAVNDSPLLTEVAPGAEFVETAITGVEASALEYADVTLLAEADYLNVGTELIEKNPPDVEANMVLAIGVEASDAVVLTSAPEPTPVGDASMAVSMSEVSATLKNYLMNCILVEHQPEVLPSCLDVSMVASNAEFSDFNLVTNGLNPPIAPKDIDDEIGLMIGRSNVSGKSRSTGFAFLVFNFHIGIMNVIRSAGAQSVEGGLTGEEVISMLVSQMDFSASAVDSMLSMVAKEVPKRKVTYTGRWGTNNVDGRPHFTVYDAHILDSMIRIDFTKKDPAQTREVASHDQVIPTAGVMLEPEVNGRIIEGQDLAASRAGCADVSDSSAVVSRPEAPVTTERSSLGEMNEGDACHAGAVDVRSHVGGDPTAEEFERSAAGAGGSDAEEVASMATKSNVPGTGIGDVVVVEQAAERIPTTEGVVNVSSEMQVEGVSAGSRSISDSRGNKKGLRSRRMLVDSVDAVEDNATMEISVASLAGKRNYERRLDASEGAVMIEQVVESTPAAEAMMTASSEAQARDPSMGSRISSDPRVRKRSLRCRRMLVDGVDAMEDNVTMEMSVTSLAGKRNGGGRKDEGEDVVVAEQTAKSTLTTETLVIAPSEKHAEADAVDAVEDDVTMEIGAASLVGKQNAEQRESDDLVVVELAADSTPTAEDVAIVPNAAQAEDGSVGSRSASDSQSNKRSLRSRRMLVNSVDAVGENATTEISVASPVDCQSGVQSEGEVEGTSRFPPLTNNLEWLSVDTITHEAGSLREAEGVTAAPSQTAAEEVSTASRSSSDSRFYYYKGDKRSWHSRRVLLDLVDAAEDNVSMDTSVASLGGKRNDEPREVEGDGVGTHEAEPSRVVENVADASSQTEAKVDLTAESAPAPEAAASVSSEIQAKGPSMESRISSDPRVRKRSLRCRRMLVDGVDAMEDNVTMEMSVTSLAGKRNDGGRKDEGEDAVLLGQAAEFASAVEAVANASSEMQAKGASLLQEKALSQAKLLGVSVGIWSSSVSRGKQRGLRSRRMLADGVDVMEENGTMEISVASLAGRRDDEGREDENEGTLHSLPRDGASTNEAEPLQMVGTVADASSQTEVEAVVVVGQTAESACTAGAVTIVPSETHAKGVSMRSRSVSCSRANKGSLRRRRVLVVEDNVTMEMSAAPLAGKGNYEQEEDGDADTITREGKSSREKAALVEVSSQTEAEGILFDESTLETPQSVSPRCVWPSPLRRSGSLGYTCPSLSAVPLMETKSKSSSSSNRVSRLIGVSVGTTRSLVSLQRRTITPQGMREIEEKLLDTSADEVEDHISPQITLPNGTTLTRGNENFMFNNPISSTLYLRHQLNKLGLFLIRIHKEKDAAKSAPPVSVPNDLSLSASCLNRTILQDMVLMPPPQPPRPLNHRRGAFTGEAVAVVAAPTASTSFAAPNSSITTEQRRSVQFAPLAEILRESPVGHWNRLSVGLTDHFDVSPIPKSHEEAVEVGPSTDDSSSSSSLSHSPIGEDYEAEARNTISSRLSALNHSNMPCHISPTGNFAFLAVEVLNRWREDQSILADGEEAEKVTEKTYSESLIPGGEALTQEQMKHVVGVVLSKFFIFHPYFNCLKPPEPSSEGTSRSSRTNRRSKPNEKTCAIDPSMMSLSQWLPPPSEGKQYDMDAIGSALRLMLMGWVEPQDPVFIPLRECSTVHYTLCYRLQLYIFGFFLPVNKLTAKSAYQHRVNAESGLRRSTRIRVAPPRDSYERVYYDVRTNPVTGRLENLPLGYLRYPNQKEVRRRQRLLKKRLQVDDKDAAAVRKRALEARLHRLAAKRRRVLGLPEASPQLGHSRMIVLESDVTWVKDGTNSLPIGKLINPKGPSTVIFDSLNEAQSHLTGGVIKDFTECEIEPGCGLTHVGPFEQSLHDITNVISVEQKRRGLHFDPKASNFFTLRLQTPNELASKKPLLAVQIGTYAIPLRKACCVLVPKGKLFMDIHEE